MMRKKEKEKQTTEIRQANAAADDKYQEQKYKQEVKTLQAAHCQVALQKPDQSVENVCNFQRQAGMYLVLQVATLGNCFQ